LKYVDAKMEARYLEVEGYNIYPSGLVMPSQNENLVCFGAMITSNAERVPGHYTIW